MLVYILSAVVPIYLLVKFGLTSDPEPINGVYAQPGKWFTLKYWLFFCMFKLRQYQNRKQRSVKAGQVGGYGQRSRSTIEDMDKVQPLPSVKDHPMAVDAVYFNGGNKDGQFLVAATARRQNRLTQTLLFIRLPGVGLLQLPSQPDTALYREEEMSYSAGGLHIEPVAVMKTWKIMFNGSLRLFKKNGDIKLVNVSLDVQWEAYTKHFDFDTDLSVWAMCETIAREKWTREFFDNLKTAHQTHYEQFGEMTGLVSIDGYGDHKLKVQGIRDHSYGNIRDWGHLHRYCIQYAHLEDGTGLCVGLISMPLTLSRLSIGYIFHPDGKMEAVDRVGFEFHECGENDNPPTDFIINFCAGGKDYVLEGHVQDAPVFYMGLEWEAKIYERMCTYNVNGKQGWGISEWDYRYKGGCPEEVKTKRKPIVR